MTQLCRTYHSECVAAINPNSDCSEINMVGNCVSGVFNTPYEADIDGVFSTAAQLASLNEIMNYKFKKNGVEQITIGIGLDYERALMIKAGCSGSGINDIVWMGDVVKGASNLCHHGNASWNDKEVMVSDAIYSNLNENNGKLLTKNWQRNCYHGNVINLAMNDWYTENCI